MRDCGPRVKGTMNVVLRTRELKFQFLADVARFISEPAIDRR